MSTPSLRNLLLQTSARLFAEAAEPEMQERIEAGEFPSELWQEIEDNGLPIALLPEDSGGAGLTWPDALAILRLAGAFALPLPLAETFIAHQLLHDAGAQAPEGPIALGLGSARTPLTAASGHLSGNATILWPGATHVLLLGQCTEGAGEERGALIAREHVAERLQPAAGRNSASEPVGRCTVSAIEAELKFADGTWQRTLELAAVCRAMMMAGAMERVLDLTIEHVQSREQFGRPIGRFQAVQQQVAALTGQVALVGVAAEAAGIARATAEDAAAAAFECASAKACASELSGPVVRTAHQLVAAIGFTREHALQRFTRRLWTWRDDFGDENYWQQQVGRAALAAGGKGLWPLLSRS
jgi:acyl-CoA dehydrogenase